MLLSCIKEKVMHIHHEDHEYSLRYRIITVSSTRTPDTDISGDKMESYIGNKSSRSLIRDDEKEILSEFFLNYSDSDIFIYIGGTGVSRLDRTSLVLRKIADKEMPGFGELFRQKSGGVFPYLSNASLFIYREKIIFTLPGSEDAQEIAYSIIKEMVPHLYHEITKE
ncbi:molybdenum cofactor biosynthesis protein B [Ferroplasma acidarmanus Fer1]|uniref:Molybdenum cofactor biosynthesis protein B n=2 Tax=Ferroplasma TaxID=74968 RepID=S0ATZ7_FERAC|nr:molybdenum cofactor biosynthesis protein B [Ferroplasma acidarmanus Fer1]